MKIDKIKSEELKHTFSANIPSHSIKARWNERIGEIASEAKLPGFRPGKVPHELIRSRYGKELLHEIVEAMVSETLKDTMEKEGLRAVVQPNITASNIDENFSADNDMEFSFEVSVAPDIVEIDYSVIEIEAPEVAIGKDKIDEFLKQLSESNRPMESAPKAHKAEQGDITIIDFEGFIGDTPFEGGRGEEHRLQLGSGQFIPGFEDGLIGCKAGEKLDIHVTFPDDYNHPDLAAKAARFAVTVKSIERQGKAAIDDKLAEALGLENLKALTARAEEVLGKNFSERCNEVKKVYLLNELDKRYDFSLPEVLVESEFHELMHSLEHAKAHGQLEEEDKNKTDKELQDTYKAIAKRRVKLALIVEEVARKNSFSVSDTELSTEGFRRMQTLPPQMQQRYLQQIQQNPKVLDELRMPLLEGKVIEHILQQAKVKPKKVNETQLEAMEKDAFNTENITASAPAKKTKTKATAKKAKTKKDS